MKNLYKLTTILFLFLSYEIYSQNVYQFPLNTSELKPKDTYTLKVNDSVTLHVSSAYNNSVKKLEFILRLSSQKELRDLEIFYLDSEVEILVNHINADNWVILYSKVNNYKKEYYLTQYNLNTQTLSQDITVSFDTNAKLFSLEDYTATIDFDIEKSKLKIVEYKNINEVHEKTFTLSEELHKALNFESSVTDLFMDYIPTDRYTDVGSLSKTHLYLDDASYCITVDDKSEQTTYFIKANLQDADTALGYKKFTNKLDGNKQMRSFLLDGKLFQFSVNGKLARITVFNVETEAIDKEIDYTKEAFGPYHKYYEKSVTAEPDPNKFLNSFNKFKIVKTYDPEIFITVNKGVGDAYIIEAGHVNQLVYHYNNFWWMQQQQMMMQPKIPMNVPRGFGPYRMDIIEYAYDNMDDEILDKTYFLVVFDKSFNKTEFISQSVYPIYDVKDVQKKISELNSSKYTSSVQLHNYMWYTYYNKSTKNIVIGKLIMRKLYN